MKQTLPSSSTPKTQFCSISTAARGLECTHVPLKTCAMSFRFIIATDFQMSFQMNSLNFYIRHEALQNSWEVDIVNR